MNKKLILSAILSTVTGALSTESSAQDAACDPKVRPSLAPLPIFDLAREADLGDAAYEHLVSLFQPIEDPDLVAYIKTVGERVRPFIPGADSRIRYLLSDAPWVQAVSQVGGRIYVTRRMAAFVKDEDELAALLAHEIAHHANRDSAMAMSAKLRGLGVSSITDRRDAFEKYNLILDSWKPGSKEPIENEDEQIAADRMAVHATMRAGYRPQAMAEFWDRLAETRGRTGGWLSDVFGATRPEMKRLRETLKAQASLPPNCVAPRSADESSFAKWQSAIKTYEGWKRAEALPGLVFKKQLEQPLQPAIDRVAFSPDGRFVLAQDDTGIHVMSREPFRAVFRIDAREAVRARFTPDSSAVVFHTPSLRVEKWSLATKERVLLSEIVRTKTCLVSTLSPDGSTLACIEQDGVFLLIDVVSGADVFRKASFAFRDVQPDLMVRSFLAGLADLVFSPDGRYLLAAQGRETLAYDLVDKKTVSIGGGLGDIMRSGRGITFLDAARVAGIHSFTQDLEVVRFADGKVLSKTPFKGIGRISGASAGDTVVARPYGNYPVAALNVVSGKLLAASMTQALDVFNDLMVMETGDGNLDLRRLKEGERSLAAAAAPLLPSPLNAVTASALSSDAKWLAISEGFRGAIWNLESGKRVALMRGFAGAHFDLESRAFFADFPGFRDQPRAIGKLDLGTAKIVDARKVEPNAITEQFGARMLTIRLDAKGQEIVAIEMNDVRSNERLWTRIVDEGSPLFIPLTGGDVVLAWPTHLATSQRVISKNPSLASRLSALTKKAGEYLLEVIVAGTGATTGSVVVARGTDLSFMRQARAAGGVLAIEDVLDRVSIYSLADGKMRQRLFARRVSLSPSGTLLVAENRPGRLAIYDLATNEKRNELTFAQPLASGRFIGDQRLMVVTADQVVFLLDVGSK
jgi:hypothetical protein